MSQLKHISQKLGEPLKRGEKQRAGPDGMIDRIDFSLVDPGMEAALPANRTFREPQSNFLHRTIHRVTSMNDVPEK